MKPSIGSRWTPAESLRLTASEFEHTNPRLYVDHDSIALQRVLLAPQRQKSMASRVADVLCATVLGICGAALAVHFLAR